MAQNFDEKSGIVKSATPWGHWYQTIDEVVVIVNLERGTRAKQLNVSIKPQRLQVILLNSPNTATDTPDQVLIDGKFRHPILADEALWTIEDSQQLRIVLTKSIRTADGTWDSLLEGQYHVNVADLDSMEKKMTLERFARDNPGFDFSGAEISGNYKNGGPDLPTSS
eukprot:m.21899 g.21899  ORF g.21899 m.21899 type:complete len:167 (-) comp12564_c0_seq2:1298-1798(-)